MMKKYSLFLLLLIGSILSDGFISKAKAHIEKYDIFFGIFEKDDSGEYAYMNQITKFPLMTKETGFRFGYEYSQDDKDKYIIQTIFRLPALPTKKQREGFGALGIDNTFRSIKSTHEVGSKHIFHFNEGDPVGKWQMKVIVNDEVKGVFNFLVQ